MLSKTVTPRVFLIGEHNKKAELDITNLTIETRFEAGVNHMDGQMAALGAHNIIPKTLNKLMELEIHMGTAILKAYVRTMTTHIDSSMNGMGAEFIETNIKFEIESREDKDPFVAMVEEAVSS